MDFNNCKKCNKLITLHDCNLCEECCYCDKFIFIVNGYKVVGKAFQINEVPLLNLTVVLQYLDISESILIKTDTDTFIINTDKIDSVGWRAKDDT